jgi:anti-sigma factor RsiW
MSNGSNVDWWALGRHASEADMDCQYRVRLDAYHDGELPANAARELERHLETCPACEAELAEMRELSRSFGLFASECMSRASLERAHGLAEAAGYELRSPVLRIAGLLTGLAASVLVISSAWLWLAPAGDIRPSQVVVAPARMPEWERVAMTMEARPLPGETPETHAGPMLADARLADWMLQNLGK